MSDAIACVVDLPAGFRVADVLAFHGRDPSRLAEEVGADRLRKGLTWNGAPACLTLLFAGARARAELRVDGPLADGDRETMAALVRHMLGLGQPIELFEDTVRRHPEAGRLIERNPGLRLSLASSPFEALTWAVTGQQISVGAALSLRRKLILAAGLRHSSGLHCYPTAAAVGILSEDQLRTAGFSKAKAATVREVARRVLTGQLRLDLTPEAGSVAELGRRLLDTPGIGPWTLAYVLLRGYGWLDASLHGDAAVRRGLQSLLGTPNRPDEKETERWLAPFSPWRTLIAAHLWAWTAETARF